MGKNLTVVFLAFIMTFFIIGCTKKDDSSIVAPPAVQLTGPFPLAVGSSWTYRLTFYHPDGSTQGGTGTVVYQVTKDTIVYGEKWSYLESGTSGLYYLNRNNGVWNVLNGSMKNFFKYPATARDRYFTNLGSMSVRSIDTTITVPKGTFSCYEYSLSQSVPMADYYFLPGTGIIRIDLYEDYEETDSVRTYINSSYELSDYTLR
jgi:hypothetical protein